MSEGGKRVMEVEDFGLLRGCPWPDFWVGEGNKEAIAAVAAAKEGRKARFRGAANTAKGKPRYWDVQVAPIFNDDGKISQLLSISRDITEEWEASARERFLIEELEHRARNTFTMVLAIANQTFRGDVYSSPLKVYASRILALAQANDLAKKAHWTSMPIGEVVDAALASHSPEQNRFVVSGPKLYVSPRQALALTLAVNELATNAMKYGALSSATGGVDVSWSTSPAFEFLWRERGGPPVVEPERQGFGSRVIKEFLANDFGGAVQLMYPQDGVVCALRTPLENLPTSRP